MSDSLWLRKGEITFYFGNSRLSIPKDRFVEGVVVGTKKGGPEAIRLWRAGSKIFGMYVFSCNVAWPQTICEFSGDLIADQSLKPTKYYQLHEFLSLGNGIPAVNTEI